MNSTVMKVKTRRLLRSLLVSFCDEEVKRTLPSYASTVSSGA